MKYVFIRSWHVISFTDRGGAVRTRCGRRVVVEGTISAGPGLSVTNAHPTSDTLDLVDRSCEVCLRLTAKDAE